MLFPDEKNPVPEKRKPNRVIKPGKGPKPAPMKSETPVKKKSKKES